MDKEDMTVTDIATTSTAGAAVVSPWWLPYLQTTHDGVAFVLPFLGFAWLVMQMFYKVRNERRSK